MLDNESIIRVCLSVFSEPDIDEGKKLLFLSVTLSQRLKSRRKDGKRQRDLEDIICLFKEIDPDATPIFVARNLQKLSPVSFDHIDVTKLLKDLILLRKEINNIKDNYVTADQLTELRFEMENNKIASTMECHNVNMKKRGAYFLESGLVGLSHLSNTVFGSPVDEQSNGSGAQLSSIESPSRSNENFEIVVSVVPTDKTPPAMPESTVKRQSMDSLLEKVLNKPGSNMADLVKRPGIWQQNKPEENWILVLEEAQEPFYGPKRNSG